MVSGDMARGYAQTFTSLSYHPVYYFSIELLITNEILSKVYRVVQTDFKIQGYYTCRRRRWSHADADMYTLCRKSLMDYTGLRQNELNAQG